MDVTEVKTEAHFDLSLPGDLKTLRELAGDDNPEGRHCTTISATLLLELWEKAEGDGIE